MFDWKVFIKMGGKGHYLPAAFFAIFSKFAFCSFRYSIQVLFTELLFLFVNFLCLFWISVNLLHTHLLKIDAFSGIHCSITWTHIQYITWMHTVRTINIEISWKLFSRWAECSNKFFILYVDVVSPPPQCCQFNQKHNF